jgi:amidohydrolase 1
MEQQNKLRRIAAQRLYTNVGKPIDRGGVELLPDGTIARVFQLESDAPEPADVEFHNGILIPGFVNAHTHLELSFFDNVFVPGGSMVAFLKQIDSLRMEINDGIIQNALAKAYDTFRQEGIVAYGDICNQADTVGFKRNESFRSVSFIEMFGANKELGEKAFEVGKQVLAQFKAAGIVEAYLTPHAPYSVGRRLMELMNPYLEQGRIFSFHFAETAQEYEYMRTGQGEMERLYREDWHRQVDLPNWDEFMTWVEHLGGLGKLILLVHCVRLTREEMDRLRKSCPGVSIVLCPASNLFMEGRLADIEGLYQSGIRIAIGTDSLSSSPSLSILDQLKLIQRQYTHLPLGVLIQWATYNGAQALGFSELGIIEEGKRPGVNLLQGPQLLQGCLKDTTVTPIASNSTIC